jgi:UDP-N-acetylglucosamine 2-epimerase
MEKLKVMTVVGTRPEIIRLSRVLCKLDQYMDHVLVHTGQNYDYELSEIFFKDLNLRKPDHFLNAASGTSSATIGNIISKIDEVIDLVRPEAFLVLGDTNSCLSVISAKRKKIPIFHMEAGNRCFDDRVPEEINRRIVDHTSDINLPYSDIAREYLLRENIPADRIIKTGSPMYEVLHHQLKQIDQSDVLRQLNLTTNEYFVVSAHREENIDNEKNFNSLCDSLNEIAKKYKKKIIFSVHPRTLKRIEASSIVFDSLISVLKPLGFNDYNCLQKNAFAVLSDSGTITEESSILNFPALNIREAHERPEGMEQTPVILSGLNKERIMQSLELVVNQPRGSNRGFMLVDDYSQPNVSDKIIRIIQSYTDYVNRVVWRKYQ